MKPILLVVKLQRFTTLRMQLTFINPYKCFIMHTILYSERDQYRVADFRT